MYRPACPLCRSSWREEYDEELDRRCRENNIPFAQHGTHNARRPPNPYANATGVFRSDFEPPRLRQPNTNIRNPDIRDVRRLPSPSRTHGVPSSYSNSRSQRGGDGGDWRREAL